MLLYLFPRFLHASHAGCCAQLQHAHHSEGLLWLADPATAEGSQHPMRDQRCKVIVLGNDEWWLILQWLPVLSHHGSVWWSTMALSESHVCAYQKDGWRNGYIGECIFDHLIYWSVWNWGIPKYQMEWYMAWVRREYCISGWFQKNTTHDFLGSFMRQTRLASNWYSALAYTICSFMGLVRSWCLRMVSFRRFDWSFHGLMFFWWIYLAV